MTQNAENQIPLTRPCTLCPVILSPCPVILSAAKDLGLDRDATGGRSVDLAFMGRMLHSVQHDKGHE